MSAARKVLIIASWYPGPSNPTAGIFIRQQVDALETLCDVAVIHVGWGESQLGLHTVIEDGVTVVRAETRAGVVGQLLGVRKAGFAAFEVVRDEWGTPDIVHVQALWPAATVAREIKKRFGIPYVVTEHSEEYLAQSERRLAKYPLMVKWLLRPLALGASRTIAVSEFLAGRLVELGLAVDPVVIPNVVPLVPPLPIARTVPRAIAHVSVMGPAKNIGSLLEAVERLRRRRTDFVLRLVGDGECRPELESLRARLGVEDIVEFTGRKSPQEVREILAASAFTVVSSTHETFSVSAAESLMAGRPVVSTRCGGPEEFITPEVGRLVAVDDVDALATGLDWMLDHYTEYDPDALHDYAVSRFSPAVVAYRIVEVYRKVLDE